MKSIRAKLSLATFGSGVCVVGLFAWLVYQAVESRVFEVARTTLDEHLDHEWIHWNRYDDPDHAEPKSHGHEVFVRIARNGVAFFDSFPSDLSPDDLLEHRSKDYVVVEQQRTREGKAYDLVAVYDLVPTWEYLEDLRNGLLLGALVVSILLVPLSWFAAGWVLRPFRRLADATDRLGTRSLEFRFPEVAVNDEYGRLVHAFNGVLERLETGFSELRRYAANASHEIRTPLAAIIAQGEMFLRRCEKNPDSVPDLEPIRRMLAQAKRLGAVTGQLLSLSAVEVARREKAPEPILLRDVYEAVRERVEPMTKNGPSLVWDIKSPDAQVKAPLGLLDTALGNLVANGLRYAKSRVGVATYVADGRVFLVVDDDGHGLRPEQRAVACQPFKRGVDGDPQRAGTGLGLAIVDACVTACAGDLRLAASPWGGLRVIVDLPLENPT